MAKEQTKNYIRTKIYPNGNKEVTAQGTVEALDKIIDDADTDAIKQNITELGAKVGELSNTTANISTESATTEEDAIAFETDSGVKVGQIDENGADFKNLKSNGKEVLTEHQDISQLATKAEVEEKQDTLIAGKNITIGADGKTISAEGGIGDLPITKESETSEDDSIEFVNESGNSIMRITPERVMVEEITDMEGNPIGSETDKTLSIENRPADAKSVGDAIKELNQLQDYEITNYGLFVEIYPNKIYNSNGQLTNTSQARSATSLAKLEKNKDMYFHFSGGIDVLFFDTSKAYISTLSGKYNATPLTPADYPENAEYVAFDFWNGTVMTPKFVVSTKRFSGARYLEKMTSNIKKIRGQRPIINIYTTDSEDDILRKLADAFMTEDCDVYWEHGEYLFDSIFKKMYDDYAQRNYLELPIGGRCRYFLNGSTLIGDSSSVNSAGYSATIDLLSCTMGIMSESYEIYDGALVGYGMTYIIHDECGGKDSYYTHYCEGVKLVMNSNGLTNTIRKCVGGGAGKNGVTIYDNCRMYTDYEDGYDLSFHGASKSITDHCAFKVELRDCYFSHRIQLAYYPDNFCATQSGTCIIAGCSMKTYDYVGAENVAEGTENAWSVTRWNTEIRN